MNVFAGFWVDGAVRKPEQRHCDNDDTVLAKWKRKCDEQTLGISNEFDICRRSFSKWDCVYWLDTTPRESLTPEELFSVVRIIWPKCENVFDPGSDASVEWQVQLDDTNEHTPIAWGNLTQYPPHAEPQWICITKENIKSHLFQKCRFRNSTAHEWRDGVICGWDDHDCCCLVNSDYVEEIPIMNWKYVEVQT